MKRGTPRHYKVDDLMRIAKVRRSTAIGWLELLWHATAEFSPQGDIGKCSDRWIEAQMDWCGKPGVLIQYLIDTGWIDCPFQMEGGIKVLPDHHQGSTRFLVHDWHDHADDAVKKRLLRNGLQFLTIRDKVTGLYPVSDREMSATHPDNGSLPEPLPLPKPEPLPTAASGDASADKPPKRLKSILSPDQQVWFDEWYALYPRHESRGTAEKAYHKFAVDKAAADKLLQGLKTGMAKLMNSEPEFRPLPASWLNAHKWKDETPSLFAQNGNGHAPAAKPQRTPAEEAKWQERLRIIAEVDAEEKRQREASRTA